MDVRGGEFSITPKVVIQLNEEVDYGCLASLQQCQRSVFLVFGTNQDEINFQTTLKHYLNRCGGWR